MSKTKPTVIRVSESFTIRKIAPKDINIRYFKGEYNNRGLPNVKIRTSTFLGKIGKEVGKNSSSETYRFVDRCNNNQTILTTNHTMYNFVMASQINTSNPSLAKNKLNMPILKCKYCKRSITKSPIGIPISMTLQADEAIFSVIDNFCDFECAFSYLKRRTSENRFYKGPLYMNAEQLLYCMYYRMYPDRTGQSIREKPDWDLLRENGGPLSNEEFDTSASEYVPVTSVIMLPSKKQYLKLNLKNVREN